LSTTNFIEPPSREPTASRSGGPGARRLFWICDDQLDDQEIMERAAALFASIRER